MLLEIENILPISLPKRRCDRRRHYLPCSKKTTLIIGLTDLFEQKYTKLFFVCL
jgi:hypothetical protein